MTYSAHFADEEDAGRYDDEQYAPSSYSSLLWQIEKRQLSQALDRYAPESFDYLDFACGTGRVLEQVAPRARSSTGIDVSRAMVTRARQRLPEVQILDRDITAGGAPVESHYDVITAYRFLLNAEPALRVRGLLALRHRLKNSSSVLFVNNHGNLASHKALLALPHWLRHRGRRLQSGNVLTHRGVLQVANLAGLRAERVAGCGVLGGHLASHLPQGVAERVEGWAARTQLSRLASNQLYVLRLRPEADDRQR